ncbi:terpene synthase family protein [Amycolatopsis sp. NPDC054798]
MSTHALAHKENWAEQAASLRIPTLRRPPPPRSDQYAARQDQASRLDVDVAEWARNHGLAADARAGDTVLRRRYGQLATMSYPQAPDSVARAIARFLALGFEVDDSLEPRTGSDLLQLHRQLLELQDSVVRYAEPSAGITAAAHAVRDVCLRLEQVASPSVFGSLQSGLLTWLSGVACENSFLSAGAIPSPADYQRIRLATLGNHLMPLVQLAHGFDLPPRVLNHGTLANLNAAALTSIATANDLLTCRAELSREQFALNLPLVLARHHGCSLQQAVDRVAELHDAAVGDFADAARQLRLHRDDTIARYLDGLCAAVRGWHDWTLSTARYDT